MNQKESIAKKSIILSITFISVILFLIIFVILTEFDNCDFNNGSLNTEEKPLNSSISDLNGEWLFANDWVDLDSVDSIFSVGLLNEHTGIFSINNQMKVTYKMTIVTNSDSASLYFNQTPLIEKVFINNEEIINYSEEVITLSELGSENNEYEIIIYAMFDGNNYNSVDNIKILFGENNQFLGVFSLLSQIKYILIGFYITVMLIGYILGKRSHDIDYFLFFIFLGFIHVVVYLLFIPPYTSSENYVRSTIWLNEMWTLFSFTSMALQIVIIHRVFNKYASDHMFYLTIVASFIVLLLYLITGMTIFNLISSTILGINYFFILYDCIRGYIEERYYSLQIFIITSILISVKALYFLINYVIEVNSYAVLFDYFFVYSDLTLFFGIMSYFFKRFSDDYTVSLINAKYLSEEVKMQNEELTLANDQLKGMEESRTKMLNNIAHDIRTPITSILTYLELMNDGVISNDDIKKYIPKMLLRLNHVKKLSAKLYEVMEFETQDDRFKLNVYSTKLLFNEIEIMLVGEKKYNYVDIDIDNKYDGYIVIDYAYIIRVITNLVDNAYRYVRKDGKGKIEVICEEYDDDFVIFKVIDNGIGIEKNHLSKVFGRFYRADSSRINPGDHQGLGLTICYEVVKYHGGNIWVESEHGKGAAFMFTIKKQKEIDDNEKRD